MLSRRPPPDDQSEDRMYGIHPGDLGLMAIAAMCTICLILMFILPSPFAKVGAMKAAAAKVERQKEINKAVATGEVSVGISSSKDH